MFSARFRAYEFFVFNTGLALNLRNAGEWNRSDKISSNLMLCFAWYPVLNDNAKYVQARMNTI